jgi:hypothetical protein
MAAALPALLFTLHALGLAPIAWRTTALEGFQPGTGHAYIAPLPSLGYPTPPDPTAIVKENGVALPFPSMPGWGSVGERGQGRYHLSGGQIYLSTPDNSDPRSNGRRYTIEYPWPIPRRLMQVLWLVALAGLAIGLVRARAPIVGYLRRPPFWTLALALGVMVVANRLWVFTDYPIVAVHPDSGGYFAIAEQIGSGVLPNFGNRPPMYPLFLKAVFTVQDRLLALAFAQSLLSFAGALTLVYGATRWSPALGVPATVMLGLYLFGFQSMEHDTAMLSESLYASFLMFAFGALIAGLRQARPLWLAVASASMGFAILTRPAGMFLLVTFAIVAAWLLWRRFPRVALAAFAIPLPLLMLSMSYYNLRVVRAFAPTTWGEANLAVATFLYWEPDPSYPPEINADVERIRTIIQGRYDATGKDRTVLDRSWHPNRLGAIYVESFNAAALDIAQMMGGHYETTGRYWIRRIAFDSIAKHPLYYGKFVYAMLFNYFRPAPDYDFRLYLQNRAWVHYVARTFAPEKGNGIMTRMAKELAAGIPRPPLVVASFDTNDVMDLQDRVLLPATWKWRLYHLTHRARQFFFERWIWTMAVFAGLLASTYLLMRSRVRHDGAFVLFIVTVSALGASLVVSLVEFSQPRYSYPMEWAYGMSAVLLPLLASRFAQQSGTAAR